MDHAVDALILDLLAWIAAGERSYADVMEAWRTSCPRLPVWEKANDLGYILRRNTPRGAIISLTDAGRALLAKRGASTLHKIDA